MCEPETGPSRMIPGKSADGCDGKCFALTNYRSANYLSDYSRHGQLQITPIHTTADISNNFGNFLAVDISGRTSGRLYKTAHEAVVKDISPGLPLVVRQHAVEEEGDLSTYVSSHRLNQSFEFKGVGVSAGIHHLADIYPSGPLITVLSGELSTLVQHFRFFTVDQLLTLGNAHGECFASSSKKIMKAALQSSLISHQCNIQCKNLKYVFKILTKDRRAVRLNPINEEDLRIAVSKAKQRNCRNQKFKRSKLDDDTAEHKLAVDRDSHLKAYTASNVKKDVVNTVPDTIFPRVSSTTKKRQIISEWQSEMDLNRWFITPCAVCAQRIPRKDIRQVSFADVDFTLLQNPYIPDETRPTTYNLQAYQGAILYPKGLHNKEAQGPLDMCMKCETALVQRNQQPKDSLANWHYTGHDELPEEVRNALKSATMFDVMMVARSRATRITQLFSKKKGNTNYDHDPSESQRYDRGNISIIPQDSAMLRPLLPPDSSEIQTAMAALFSGSKEKPTADNISKLSPVLVSKTRVRTILEFLLTRNPWYQASGAVFSPENYADLFCVSDANKDEAVPKAVDLCWLPPDKANQTEGGNADYTDRNEYTRSKDSENVVMEAVGYTAGDRSPQNYRIMKASALAWCLSRKKFIKMNGGSQLLSDRDPAMLTYLFPHLDPWGLVGFYQSQRTASQYISFERQVKNLLLQDDSPFQADPNFAYVCWNILQKREVNKTASFRTNLENQKDIVAELTKIGPAIPDLIGKWEKNPMAKPSNRKEKQAMAVLNRLKLVAKELKGSSGYKLCRRNEIRALMKKYSTPALFITINPADLYHPLLGVLGGKKVEEWRAMDRHERAVFVARHPGPAAQFFDVMMKAFLDIIIRHGKEGGGLFGESETYYGMVEAQGRGTLHCHMLIWIKGNPNPQELRNRMADEPGFRLEMFDWIESVIQCQLPDMEEELQEPNDALPRPTLPAGAQDPRIKQAPQVSELSEDEFAVQFRKFVTELAVRCNWHEHSDTCWKHLKSGERRGDPVCRMRIDGKTRAFTDLDEESQSILIKRLHPRINNFNDVVIFLMQCNMDVKYIGSGEAAKALVYYVTDYITKESLATHVGLGALAYAIQQNDVKYYDDKMTLESAKGKSLFVKTVNAMMARQETSHQQVLSYLIGGGDHYKANSFRLLKWAEVDRHIRAELKEQTWKTVDKQKETCQNDSDLTKEPSEVSEQPESHTIDIDEDPDSGFKEELSLQVDQETLVPVNLTMDYCHRSQADEYDNLSLWEHTEWVCKITKKSEGLRIANRKTVPSRPGTRKSKRFAKPKAIAGKKPTARGDFSWNKHPNYKTHTNRFREVPFIPVLLGKALPRCDRGPTEREQWCRAMIIIFKPWRKPKDLKEENQSWTDTFESTSFDPRMSKIINNMNVENECKDARDSYNQRRQAGVHSDTLLDNFGFDDHDHGGMANLETAILNDNRLDREDNQDDVDEDGLENVHTIGIQNGPADELVAIATQAGLFKPQATKGLKPAGNVALVNENEKGIMKMQSTLMAAMRKDKRPATKDALEYNSPHKRERKLQPREPDATLTEVEEAIEITHVMDRDDAPYSPEDALENVIDDLDIRGNKEQERAVRIVGEHFISETEEQMLCHVSGPGGTGKSHVVRAIVELFKRCGASEKLMMSASTGCAAILIDGYTLHALTFLGPYKTKTNQELLERLWKDVKYLVVDEVSMISAHFFHQVSERISKAKSWDTSMAGKPFGGVNLVVTGDIGQLKPVNAASLFSHTLVEQLNANVAQTPKGQEALNGAFLWRQLNKVVVLKKNVRAKGDDAFINMLSRIREGRSWNNQKPHTHLQAGNGKNYTQSDYEVLLSRRLTLLAKANPRVIDKFKHAPIVVGEKVLRDALNNKIVEAYAQHTGQELCWYHADDRFHKAPLGNALRKRMLRAKSNITDDAIGMLPLIPGMKVMITDNLAMRGKVANGCEGIIKDIKYEINEYGHRRAICAYVLVPGAKINAPGLPPDIVPILPETNSFKYKDPEGKIYYITRTQLPLVPAYAFTANKIQGQSLELALVDLRSAKGTQALYVMISRAISLNNLAVLRWFPSGNVDRRLSPEYRNEFERLRLLDERTTDEFNKRKWRPATHRMPKNRQDVAPLKVDASANHSLAPN